MVWPWRRKSRKRIARVVMEGPINGATRQRVLKALREVEEREFPALVQELVSVLASVLGSLPPPLPLHNLLLIVSSNAHLRRMKRLEQ